VRLFHSEAGFIVSTPEYQRDLRGILLLLCVLLSFSLALPDAAANSWRTYGLGARAVAMGGAYTAIADDFSAGYYNPAGILAHPGAQFGIGYQYVKEDLKANGTEVPTSRDSDGIYLGGAMTIPFTDELKDRIAIGYLFLQPLFYSLDLLIPETTEPQFPVLESMARMQIIHVIVAFDCIPGALIGGGVTISTDLGGALDLQPGVGGFGGVEEVLSSVDQEVHPMVSGTAGVLFRLGRYHKGLAPFTVGFTWRDKHYLDLDIPVSVVLSGFLLRLDLTSVFLYSPRQWVLGLGYQVSRDLLLSCDVSYNEWSDYRVPSLSIATQIDIPFIVLKQGVNEPPGFKDTVTPRFGLEYCPYHGSIMDGVVRAGYFYEPSPVPEQTGATNYMDADRHGFNWGIGLFLKKFLGKDLSRNPISFDVGVSFHLLEERTHTKGPATRPDNPGYPEITTSGNTWYFTCGFTYGSRYAGAAHPIEP